MSDGRREIAWLAGMSRKPTGEQLQARVAELERERDAAQQDNAKLREALEASRQWIFGSENFADSEACIDFIDAALAQQDTKENR